METKTEKQDGLDWEGFFNIVLAPPGKETLKGLWSFFRLACPELFEKPAGRFWLLRYLGKIAGVVVMLLLGRIIEMKVFGL